MPELNSSTPDPIPPVSFTALVGFVLKALLTAIGDFVRFIGKHKILILVFSVFGILFGILQFKVSTRFYSLKMVVRHTELTNRVYGQMLDNLNLLAETGSYAALGTALNLDSALTYHVKSITGLNLDGVDLRKDTTTTDEGIFVIQCHIKDTRVADTLEKALVDYFNSNAFLNKLKMDKYQIREERLQFMDGELRKMDSLKDAYTKALAVGKTTMSGYNAETSPADIFKEANLVSTERALVQQWLHQGKRALIPIDGFKPSIAPASMGLPAQIVLNLLIFFLFGSLLAGILETQKTKKE